MRDWLVVADDVTGALDAAVGFAGTGRRVVYAVAPRDEVADADVLAVSTGSRARPDGTADLARRTVAWASGAGFARLFVKVDSTLRGAPAEHVRGALTAWRGAATAVVCPAVPALGRTVVGGRVLVGSVPARRSDAGRDPVAPTREDRLDALFGAPVVGPGEVAGLVGTARAVVVDAATDDDLATLARAIDAAGPAAVPVGAAGLAAALGALRRTSTGHRDPVAGDGSADRLPTARDLVVLATSAHPVARAQLAALGRDDLVVAPPPLATASLAHGGSRFDHDPVFVVDESPPTAPAVTHADAADAAAEAAARAARRIAETAADGVVVLGGDGIHALLAALGADGVDVHGALLPGVPWGRIRGGTAPGLLVVTKAGGFGGPSTLVDIVATLTKETR